MMRAIGRRRFAGLAMGVAGALVARRAAAEVHEVRFGIQYGLTYLPFAIMEHERLVEKHAAKAGLAEPVVTYFRAAGGDTLNDGLISGNLDFVATGIPSFLKLWSRGHGKIDIKGLASYGYSPIVLMTRNPAVHSVKDFTDRDRIALPAVGTSVQSIFLQMAAEKAFGPGQSGRLDSITVARSHPDAVAAVLGNTEIDSHFTVPPYIAEYERANKGIHAVISGDEVVGAHVSNGMLYLTERFHRANPATIAAVMAALDEAIGIINADPHRAADLYLATTHERTTVETILGILASPGVHYDTVPRGAMTLARFMASRHTIAAAPKRWEDLFFPEAPHQPGSG
jgi:NitT/TauT family transport system substrate-binding protein